MMDFYSATVPNSTSLEANDELFLAGFGLGVGDFSSGGIDPAKLSNTINHNTKIKQHMNFKHNSNNSSSIKVGDLDVDLDELLDTNDSLNSMSSLSYDFVVDGEAFHLGEEQAAKNYKNVSNNQQQQQPRQRSAPRFSPEAMSTNFETIVKRSLNQNQSTPNGLDSGVETGYINKFSPPETPVRGQRQSTRESPRRRNDLVEQQIKIEPSKKNDKDSKYFERRRKNNLAAHKSRLKVKMKQQQIFEDNKTLLFENEQLRSRVDFLLQEIEKLKSLCK